jgi:hypothetical protein
MGKIPANLFKKENLPVKLIVSFALYGKFFTEGRVAILL